LQRLDVSRGFLPTHVQTNVEFALPNLPADTIISRNPGIVDLLADDSLELIWIPGGGDAAEVGQRVEQTLQSGKHVIIGSATEFSPDDWLKLEKLSLVKEKMIRIHFPGEFESGFQLAARTVGSGKLGRLRSILCLEYAFAGPVVVPSDTPLHAVGDPLAERGIFVTRGLEALYQIVSLHPAPVERIYARASNESELLLQLEFADGLTAQWEYAVDRTAPLRTGWQLEGTQGGFADRHAYRVEADGELVKTPLEPVMMPTDPFLGAVYEALRSADSQKQTPSAQYRQVFQLAAATRRSLAGGNWVDVEQDLLP
ncbi:MAG: hypothetical protein KDA68_11900, partial [Planctomycetaceae bacterium]|nr:hypothetical protein [Planctomycetaceae bacterium]